MSKSIPNPLKFFIWFNYGFLSVGIGVNAAILYGIGVLVFKNRG